MKVTTSFRKRFSPDGTVYRKCITLECSIEQFERLNDRINVGREIFKHDHSRKWESLKIGDNYTTLTTADCVCDFLHENIDYFFGNEFAGISENDWQKAKNYNHFYNTMVRIKVVA